MSRPEDQAQPAPVRRRRVAASFPLAMLVLAAAILAAYSACQLAGLRECLPVVFGTTRPDRAFGQDAVFFAGLYATLYVCTVTVVPILLLAAAIFSAVQYALVRFCGRLGRASA